MHEQQQRADGVEDEARGVAGANDPTRGGQEDRPREGRAAAAEFVRRDAPDAVATPGAARRPSRCTSRPIRTGTTRPWRRGRRGPRTPSARETAARRRRAASGSGRAAASGSCDPPRAPILPRTRGEADGGPAHAARVHAPRPAPLRRPRSRGRRRAAPHLRAVLRSRATAGPRRCSASASARAIASPTSRRTRTRSSSRSTRCPSSAPSSSRSTTG